MLLVLAFAALAFAQSSESPIVEPTDALPSGIFPSDPVEVPSASPEIPVNETSSAAPSPSSTIPPIVLTSTNDIWALQYMYVVERLDRDFFNISFGAFESEDYVNAGYDPQVETYLGLMNSQVEAHLAAITELLTLRNVTLPANCTFEFNFTSPVEFVTTAAVIQNLMVEAYDGVINRISDEHVQLIAITIATVKARHAAYLNLVNFVTPFNSTFDVALPPRNVTERIFADYISTCPTDLNLPIPRNETVPQTTWLPHNSSSAWSPASSAVPSVSGGVGPADGNSASGLTAGTFMVSLATILSMVAGVFRRA